MDSYYEVPYQINEFFHYVDLGPSEPELVNGLEFNEYGNLLDTELVNPNSPSLSKLLENMELYNKENLFRLINIYAMQHNMFKHASVNRTLPPYDNWDFKVYGVTHIFQQTFGKYIPKGKEYAIDQMVIKQMVNDIIANSTEQYPSDMEYYRQINKIIFKAYQQNKNNIPDFNRHIIKITGRSTTQGPRMPNFDREPIPFLKPGYTRN